MYKNVFQQEGCSEFESESPECFFLLEETTAY